MTLSLQQNLSSRDIKTLLFQSVIVGREPKYLVYLAPEGEDDGYFGKVEGEAVWFSGRHPEGVECQGTIVSKAIGDEILNRRKPESEQEVGKIERF